MRLYCVFGVEYHISRDLLGIYSTNELALKAVDEFKEYDDWNYDDIIIEEVMLDSHRCLYD